MRKKQKTKLRNAFNNNISIDLNISKAQIPKTIQSNLCDFSDVYIVVKGTITVTNPDNPKWNKSVAFKNNAPFINFISKINDVQIDNVKELDVVILMYNLLEYSENYKKTTGSLWNYYRDEPNNSLSSNSESFKYKTSITGNTYNVGNGKDNYDANKVGKNETEIYIPRKYLSNFWRALNIPLINCEIQLILTLSKNCLLADMTKRNAKQNNTAIVPQRELEFQIKYTKLYDLVVTLSKENDIKLLEQLKTGFIRTIKSNKYRSQMTIENNNNNLNYLIDPTFTNVNKLSVLSFERIEENNVQKGYKDFFSHYYVPNAEIKNLNVLIYGKRFFDLQVKNGEETYENIIDISNNNDYTTRNLLDFSYGKENYRLIAIDLSKKNLSKKTKSKDPQ